MKKTLLCLLSVFAVLTAVADPPLPVIRSSALQAFRIFKTSGGFVHSIEGYNSSASTVYILIFDAAAVPAEGAFTNTLLQVPFAVPAKSTFVRVWPNPAVANNGVVVVASTTDTTKTLATAVCRFQAQIE